MLLQTITSTKNYKPMRKFSFLLMLALACSTNLFAQETKPIASKQLMQITTIESVVGGGMGRSKMIITDAEGKQTETELSNLFSMAGINFGNIKENEDKVLRTIRQYTSEGWKLEQTVPLSLSPSGNSMGIFMTRYLLSKEEVKKVM